MDAGAYLSSKSEKEVTEKESEAKGIRKRGTTEEERERLVRVLPNKRIEEAGGGSHCA